MIMNPLKYGAATAQTFVATQFASVPVLTTVVSPFIAQALLVAAVLTATVAAATVAAALIARTMYKKVSGKETEDGSDNSSHVAGLYGRIINAFSASSWFKAQETAQLEGASAGKAADMPVDGAEFPVDSVGFCSKFLSFIPSLERCFSKGLKMKK